MMESNQAAQRRWVWTMAKFESSESRKVLRMQWKLLLSCATFFRISAIQRQRTRTTNLSLLKISEWILSLQEHFSQKLLSLYVSDLVEPIGGVGKESDTRDDSLDSWIIVKRLVGIKYQSKVGMLATKMPVRTK